MDVESYFFSSCLKENPKGRIVLGYGVWVLVLSREVEWRIGTLFLKKGRSLSFFREEVKQNHNSVC